LGLVFVVGEARLFSRLKENIKLKDNFQKSKENRYTFAPSLIARAALASCLFALSKPFRLNLKTSNLKRFT